MSTNESLDYRLLWAKSNPYHPLWCHMLDVAAVCQALLPRFGTPEGLSPNLICYLAALHDIGKADFVFQMKDPTLCKQLQAHGFPFPASGSNLFPGGRHEACSAEWAVHSLGQLFPTSCKTLIRTAAKAIEKHHDHHQPKKGYVKTDYQQLCHVWDKLRFDLDQMLQEVLEVHTHFPQPTSLNLSAFGMKLLGLIVLSDWIASNTDLYNYQQLNKSLSPEDYYEQAKKLAKEAVTHLALHIAPSNSEPLHFDNIFPTLKPRPTQQLVEQVCLQGLPPGLVIIEAPMGEGKTEAAFYLVEHWNRTGSKAGAYIALPTMATSNQMHERYSRFLASVHPSYPAPRLIHGMAWLLEDDVPTTIPQIWDESHAPVCPANEWFHNPRRALLAPDGVGTVDQVLRASLYVRYGFLRLLGLSPRTLVIDEVHAYDEYMLVLMERLLQWCRALDIPVILLSATLSKRQKERLIQAYTDKGIHNPSNSPFPYPMLTYVSPSGTVQTFSLSALSVPPTISTRTIALKHHYGTMGDSAQNTQAIVELVTDQIQEGGCLCLLVNTVVEAQQFFQALQSLQQQRKLPQDCRLYLFHARFCADQRQAIEKEVVKLFRGGPNTERPRCAILVATQVVEQSLDVDFDGLITQLAPIDLLLQRVGRLHRHPNTRRPSTLQQPYLHLLLPDRTNPLHLGGTKSVYHPHELLRTLAILADCRDFTLPSDLRNLVELCYSDIPLSCPFITSAQFTEAQQEKTKALEKACNAAQNFLIPLPTQAAFDYAKMTTAPYEDTDDEDTNIHHYLYPQTRYDSHYCTVLAIPQEWLPLVKQEKPPNKNQRRQIFLKQVALPHYWIRDVTPQSGYAPCFEGKGWLSGRHILPLKSNMWCGVTSNGRSFIIHNNATLGFQRIIEGEIDAD
jgi:CRISPR-associated endonuclease/helicase Cas3